MELIGDLKKQAKAAQSRDEAGKTAAGMELTDDELESVNGGMYTAYELADNDVTHAKTATFRVVNSAGAPIWNGTGAAHKRAQIGRLPCGAEVKGGGLAYGGYSSFQYYKVDPWKDQPAGYVSGADVKKV